MKKMQSFQRISRTLAALACLLAALASVEICADNTIKNKSANESGAAKKTTGTKQAPGANESAGAKEVPTAGEANIVWLDTLNINSRTVLQEWGTPKINKSCIDNPLTIAGTVYPRGIGTHVTGRMKINLKGEALRFQSYVGVDDEVNTTTSSINFEVYADGKKVYDSGVMKETTPAKFIDLDVKDVKTLVLFSNVGGDKNRYDHADWAEARIVMKEGARNKPELIGRKPESMIPLTPPAPQTPRINGPDIIGAGVNHDIIYYIPVTGERPMQYAVANLPEGLKLDSAKGIITGRISKAGSYVLKITASNSLGKCSREIELAVGRGIALTPPMGWNSWNCWGCAVNEKKIMDAAEGMIQSGLADHGWQYVNIDDCWQVSRNPQTGEIIPDPNFPDVRKLADSLHEKGLKFGVYSCMGTKTCAGRPGTKDHEVLDVQTYSKMGVDYVKMDWCYAEGMKSKPTYKKFGDAIREHATRDIVFSICNWGVDKPWEWGAEVGGNCWRTTGDIYDNWPRVMEIGFESSAGLSRFSKPGHWNDPDMLVVGVLGWSNKTRMTNLTPNQQYSHISLWALLASPLLMGCDLTQMDEFTLGLLTNDEVIAINQDRKGAQAERLEHGEFCDVWAKDLHDGSKAVGVFYVNKNEFQLEDVQEEVNYKLNWRLLGISGKYKARDLWRQEDLGVFDDSISFTIPIYGTSLIKLIPEKK